MIIKTFTLFFLLFFCTIGLMSVNIPDKENMFNITNTAIHNSLTNASKSVQVNPNVIGVKDIIINIIYKIVEAMLYVTEQITRLSIKLAIDHPEINFRLLMNLILIVLLLYILVPLLKIFIIVFILIKDIRTNYKEKKELKRLKEKRNG
jgi:hypothetical protein